MTLRLPRYIERIRRWACGSEQPRAQRSIDCLFVNHSGERCGVYQFGRRLFDALATTGTTLTWHYCESGSREEFAALLGSARPRLVLFNHHPATLAWAAEERLCGDAVATYAIWHEGNEASAHGIDPAPFDFLICADPTLVTTNPRVIAAPRFIPDGPAAVRVENPIFTVGSFGFATAGKGFDRLCHVVNAQFDTARIRINIPAHDLPGMIEDSALANIISDCRKAVTKPGIGVEFTHDFFDEEGLLGFLASNDLNAFLYDDVSGRGISSCIDYALASGRTVAVSGSSMFRNLREVRPSVCVDDRSLPEIARTGPSVLAPLRQRYAPAPPGRHGTG
ncbi:hypothetical protein [Methylobacterium durans]|uniref:Glycosyltransferase family 1 protein n=1 Tax=Methylobacterium durans TaxID=2202825 RepID=A0A2U8W1D0_9HYPH|nr:hypothetical protein [Methylobacterium durans]AWN39899.1 hypothetical protein DK389_04295 [Methylobacterium durans]